MAITGVGTKFYRWDPTANNGQGEWVAIAEITNISGPSASRDTEETTSLDTLGGYKTFVATFRDPGELTLAMNYTKDGYQLMLTDFQSDEVQDYAILLNDNADDTQKTCFTMKGVVTGVPLTIPKGVVTFETTIKLSGPVNMVTGLPASP